MICSQSTFFFPLRSSSCLPPAASALFPESTDTNQIHSTLTPLLYITPHHSTACRRTNPSFPAWIKTCKKNVTASSSLRTKSIPKLASASLLSVIKLKHQYGDLTVDKARQQGHLALTQFPSLPVLCLGTRRAFPSQGLIPQTLELRLRARFLCEGKSQAMGDALSYK